MPRSSSALIREIRAIGSSFRKLATAFGKIAPHLAAAPELSTFTSKGRPRRKPRLTAQQRAALKLQGKYMGTMRGLSAAKRAKIKRIRVAKGVRAAIAAAERMAG